MRRGISTGAPTKAEADYIIACKSGPCMACDQLYGDRCDWEGCDFHHMKSGNIRRGHMFGVGLCAYHHRGYPIEGVTQSQMREMYGPSLMDGGKRFSDRFGSDDELLKRQREYIGGSDEVDAD